MRDTFKSVGQQPVGCWRVVAAVGRPSAAITVATERADARAPHRRTTSPSRISIRARRHVLNPSRRLRRCVGRSSPSRSGRTRRGGPPVQPAHDETIQMADLDGDGIAGLLRRDSVGVHVFTSCPIRAWRLEPRRPQPPRQGYSSVRADESTLCDRGATPTNSDRCLCHGSRPLALPAIS